jgi:hypothetical protein
MFPSVRRPSSINRAAGERAPATRAAQPPDVSFLFVLQQEDALCDAYQQRITA